MKVTRVAVCVLVLAFAFGLPKGQADVVVRGLEGKVNMLERPFSIFGDSITAGLDFLVDVLDGAEMHVFAVSVNGSGLPFGPNTWNSYTISPAAWDAGFSYMIGENAFSTTALGPFEDRFGDDDQAILFSRNLPAGMAAIGAIDESDDQDEGSWENFPAGTGTFRYFTSFGPETEFIALGTNGEVIDHSLPFTIVPEAGAWAMVSVAAFGAAAGCLAVRRKSAA